MNRGAARRGRPSGSRRFPRRTIFVADTRTCNKARRQGASVVIPELLGFHHRQGNCRVDPRGSGGRSPWTPLDKRGGPTRDPVFLVPARQACPPFISLAQGTRRRRSRDERLADAEQHAVDDPAARPTPECALPAPATSRTGMNAP